MPDHQGGLEGVGMVVVDLAPFLIGLAFLVAVVVVMVDDGHVVAEALADLGGEGGLAAARASGDADDHGVFHVVSSTGSQWFLPKLYHSQALRSMEKSFLFMGKK